MKQTRLLLCGLACVAAVAQDQPVRLTPGEPGWVQKGIEAAFKAGRKKVVIPPGVYSIEPLAGRNIRLSDLADFEIDATGATFVYTDQNSAAVTFNNCRNTTLRGLTIRQAVLPFTQGTIEAIAPDGMFYDLRIDQGYPQFDDPGRFAQDLTGYVFDPATRNWKAGSLDLGLRAERTGPGRFRLNMKRPSGPSAAHAVAVGDLMGFRGRGSHAVEVLNCERMKLDGVTVLSAGVFAFLESGGEGDNHYTLNVKRGPKPEGATAEPLFSATADAFHSTNVRKGPTLENCYFESMPDDGIAIHGTYSFVLQSTGNKLVINRSRFRPGDPLRLINKVGEIVAEAVVREVAPLPGFQSPGKTTRVATGGDITRGPYFEVTLDRAVPGAFDFLASNPNANGSGYTLRNNTIHNHRARGMLLKADGGLIEGNTVDGSSMGGIVVTPEFWWMEACYSRNLTLRGNTIKNSSYYPRQTAGLVIGALASESYRAAEFGAAAGAVTEKVAPGRGHQHILVENNTFENMNEVNIIVTSAKDVTIRNNRFVRPYQKPKPGDSREFDAPPGTLIWLAQCDGVRLAGNTVSNAGPYLKTLVAASPTAKATGMKGGVKTTRRGTSNPSRSRLRFGSTLHFCVAHPAVS